MDPVTHCLAAASLGRAGLDRRGNWVFPVLLVAGLAPDVEILARVFGAEAYLRIHRLWGHSILGGLLLAAVVAAGGFAFLKKRAKQPPEFRSVFLVCAIGVASHVLLDLCNSYGIELLWPFRANWTAWDLVERLDPFVLLLLLAGLALPELFRLVSEEIGDRRRKARPRWGVFAALLLVLAYFGARAVLHNRALALLAGRVYHAAAPIAVAAFPAGASPFEWRGIVDTENTIEEVPVPLGPGEYFDPDASITHYKPEEPQVLEAARRAPAARTFLAFARFPLAGVERTEEGYRVEMRDLRFPENSGDLSNPFLRVDLDPQLRVLRAEITFGPPGP